jgi:hypothetical protein
VAQVPEFIETTTAAVQWMQGMAGAALAKNLGVQWCFATPTDVLAALDMPAVTNFRVSLDFCYGESYLIGLGSLLVWSVGARPSKDTLWSTDNGKFLVAGCPWTRDHEEVVAPLHVALALFSTGPVGFSDLVNHTNASLLNRTIAASGLLLQPSKAITDVDSALANGPANEYGHKGYVYATCVRALWFRYCFSVFRLFRLLRLCLLFVFAVCVCCLCVLFVFAVCVCC